MTVATKSNYTIRLEPAIKKQASDLFKSMGMDLSTAITVFLQQSLRTRSLPFVVKAADEPNEETYAAMEEAERTVGTGKTYDSARELFEDILNEDSED